MSRLESKAVISQNGSQRRQRKIAYLGQFAIVECDTFDSRQIAVMLFAAIRKKVAQR